MKLIPPLSIFLLAATVKLCAAAPEYTWTKIIEPAAFAPRDGAGALVFNDRMWLLGGWNPGDRVHFPQVTNSEVWSSADGLTWSLENPSAPWEGRHTAGYVVHQNQMYIIGGDANRGHYQSDVWKTSDGVNWEQVTADAPWGPRVLHYTVAFQDKIWVMGGQTLPDFAPAPTAFYSDVWSSSDGENWEKLADNLPWGPRGLIGGGVIFNDRMWIIGGGTYSVPEQPTRIFYNDVWSSADGIHWQQELAEAPWAAREYHDITVFDGKMWVLDGWNSTSGNRNDVWYSEDGIIWTELPDTPWTPRHATSVFVHDDALWMAAGNTVTSDVWKLTRTNPVPEPSALLLSFASLGGVWLAATGAQRRFQNP